MNATYLTLTKPDGITVRRAGENGYQATAYHLNAGGTRQPIANADGHPLVAFGKTPMHAASHLMSALRRRHVRRHDSIVATT